MRESESVTGASLSLHDSGPFWYLGGRIRRLQLGRSVVLLEKEAYASRESESVTVASLPLHDRNIRGHATGNEFCRWPLTLNANCHL